MENPQDINRQLLFKQALKSILFDGKPSKDDFQQMQKRALEDLSRIAGWVEDQPDITISEDILAVLDPKKVRDQKMNCFKKSKSGPAGLPSAKCAIQGNAMVGNDGAYYYSDGKKWVRINDPQKKGSPLAMTT